MVRLTKRFRDAHIIIEFDLVYTPMYQNNKNRVPCKKQDPRNKNDPFKQILAISKSQAQGEGILKKFKPREFWADDEVLDFVAVKSVFNGS